MNILKRLGAFFFDIFEVLVFAIGIFFFIYLLVMRPHKIKGESMHPNYPNGEYLLTEKVTYYKSEPKRGDVVVFKPPVSEDEFIKRVIGLPGDTISLLNGKVYINGKLLNEDYLDTKLFTDGRSYLTEGVEIKIGDGNYFVMGDNRTNSYDSRNWGPIKKKDISGRAWLVYWPPKSTGFVNRPDY